MGQTLQNLLNAAVFSVFGILMLVISFYIFDVLTPGKLWHEIVHNKNTALAITAAAMIIGMALVIGFAIHG
ncbi:MAG: DUF350 domain-containing protein [Bacteroidia bacterium]|nr:DUF350 domain-containing protein [Bacteroidia bacterium]